MHEDDGGDKNDDTITIITNGTPRTDGSVLNINNYLITTCVLFIIAAKQQNTITDVTSFK